MPEAGLVCLTQEGLLRSSLLTLALSTRHGTYHFLFPMSSEHLSSVAEQRLLPFRCLRPQGLSYGIDRVTNCFGILMEIDFG